MKIVIPGTLPGLNEYTEANRKNRFAGAKMKKEIEQYLCAAIKNNKPERLEQPARITLLWVERDRRRDKDNIAFAKKFVFDALVKSGVLPGDGWGYIDSFTDTFAVDAENPRLEITIERAV